MPNITNAILSYSLTILLTNKTFLSQKFTQVLNSPTVLLINKTHLSQKFTQVKVLLP